MTTGIESNTPIQQALSDAIRTQNPEIIEQVAGDLERANVKPGRGALLGAVYTKNPKVITQVAELLERANVKLMGRAALSEAIEINSSEAVKTVVEILEKINGRANPLVLLKAIKTGNPEIVTTVAGMLERANVKPDQVALLAAIETRNPKIVTQVAGILQRANVEPDVYVLSNAIMTGNPEIITPVVKHYQAFQSPLPQEYVTKVLAEQAPPVVYQHREGRDFASTILAIASYTSLPEDSPFREQSLSHIVNTEGADKEFLNRWREYKTSGIEAIVNYDKRPDRPRLPGDVAGIIANYLEKHDMLSAIQATRDKGNPLDEIHRNGAIRASGLTAGDFAARELARQQSKKEEGNQRS